MTFGAAPSVLLTGVGEIYLQEHYKSGSRQKMLLKIGIAAMNREPTRRKALGGVQSAPTEAPTEDPPGAAFWVGYRAAARF